MYYSLAQVPETFSVKGQIVYILGIVGHMWFPCCIFFSIFQRILKKILSSWLRSGQWPVVYPPLLSCSSFVPITQSSELFTDPLLTCTCREGNAC